MKKKVLLLLVSINIIGCKPAQLVVCKYSGDGRSGSGHYLTLNTDNTFEYEVMRGWTFERVLVSGNWKKEGDKLLIDSRDSLMQNSLPLSIKELMIVGIDSLKFVLCKSSADAYVNWMLVLDDILYPFINDSVVSVNIMDTLTAKQFYLTAERTLLLVPRLNRETIQTQTYTLQNKHSNYVEFSIPLTTKEFYRYASYELLNDTLTIKKNKLIWPRKKIELKPHLKEGY